MKKFKLAVKGWRLNSFLRELPEGGLGVFNLAKIILDVVSPTLSVTQDT